MLNLASFDSMLSVIINGAPGKMGQMAVKAIQEQRDMQLVAQLGRHDDLDRAIQQHRPHLVVDLTTADHVYSNCCTIIEHDIHPVIGTSGLSKQQKALLQAECQQKQLGGIIAPNFSIGAVLMMHFSEIAAKFFERSEIVEAHHMNKQDAPSATAIKTADLIHNKTTNSQHQSQETQQGALGANGEGIPIHSRRSPGVLAQQDVYFGNLGEELTIEHRSINRDSFRQGLLTCCRQTPKLTQLIDGLDQLLL